MNLVLRHYPLMDIKYLDIEFMVQYQSKYRVVSFRFGTVQSSESSESSGLNDTYTIIDKEKGFMDMTAAKAEKSSCREK